MWPFDKLFSKGGFRRASLLNLKGIGLAKRGLYKEAQELFEQAIEIAPDHPHPRISLSVILLRHGRYSQAELQLRKSLELKSDNKTQQDAWNNLANISFAQKRYNEAIDRLNRAISIYKPDCQIYYNVGTSYEQLGEWKDALDYFNCSNKTFTNSKAQLGIKRVEQRMWRSRTIDQILDSCKVDSVEVFDIEYPRCGNSRLAPSELEKVRKAISSNDSLVFFVGAGMSYHALGSSMQCDTTVSPGRRRSSSTLTKMITGSGLVGDALIVRVSGSNVILLPSPRLIVASLPSGATNVMSTVPPITFMVALEQVTAKSSPVLTVKLTAAPQARALAED